jgi:hypothetical protein
MSVWQSIEQLRNFVYRSMHVELIRQRADWFGPTQYAFIFGSSFHPRKNSSGPSTGHLFCLVRQPKAPRTDMKGMASRS